MSFPCITCHCLAKCTGTEIHLNGSEEQPGSGKVELDNGVHLDDGMLLCL